MIHTLHKSIAWFLIVALAIISGVGEGLHSIPGCGHGVETGNGLLLLGISLPEREQPVDDRPTVERPEDFSIPIYDEELCEICLVVGLSCTSADSVQFVLVVPFVDNVPELAPSEALSAAVRLYHTRAPPLV